MRSETGGLPPGGVIPLSVPFIAGNEWTYVKDCLDTTWVSSVGSYVDRFEQMVAGVVGTKHATAVINGTSALQIANVHSSSQRNPLHRRLAGAYGR
jgi:dTDP-4-amino-4,6-dideoxygalactose transaminase